MASSRAGLTAEGALYEAVARGNKDTYFFQDDPDKTLNPFENRYDRIPPFIHELRRIPPLNGAEFGRSCEFEFEVAGDLFVKPTVLIDLPSWLPPVEAEANLTQPVTDLAGNTYGYTNGIAYYLFKKIQIYQDKLLLQEYSGDSLFASRASRGTLNSAYLENTLTGWHDGSVESIALNATPTRLRLELPFLGGANGFPSIAMRRQPFKLRLELRPLEEIVETSDTTLTVAPTPWNIPLKIGARTFQPLSRTAIASPTLQLETRHMYTDGETQIALRKKSIEIPYTHIYENTFTFSPADYAPLVKGVPSYVSRRVDAQHPASRLLWFFRTQNDLRTGRRWRLAPSATTEYYTGQSLIIAGRDRETFFSPFIWNALTHHAKEERDPGAGIGEMSWDLGDIFGRSIVERQPEGSVNFTTADRPTLYTGLAMAPDDTLLGAPSTEMTAIVDTWSLYTIENDRGFLKYGN
ncbi:hypothetical protein EBR66_04990 [bacterium]|nr:hypothetical protein [bacterium]